MWKSIKQWSGRILATSGVVSFLGFLWNVVFPIPGHIGNGLAWANILAQVGWHLMDPLSLFFAGATVVCFSLGTAKWWLPLFVPRLSKKQDPPVLPESAEPTREYTSRTPHEIIDEAHLHYFYEEPWASTEIGRWLRFDGKMWPTPDTRRDPIEITMDSHGDGGLVILNFDYAAWRSRLEAHYVTERMKGEGKDTGVAFNSMTLHECELVGVVE